MFFKIEGKGKIELNVEPKIIEGDFKICFYIGQKAEVFVDLDFASNERVTISNQFHDGKNIEARLTGRANGGKHITIEKMGLVSIGGIIQGKPQPLKFKVISNIAVTKESPETQKGETTIRFLISNFFFSGPDNTFEPDGSWRANRFLVKIDGLDYNFIEYGDQRKTKEFLRKNPNQSAITCEILVNTDLSNREKVLQTVDNLCALLSFAKGTSIVPICEQHFRGEEWLHTGTFGYHVGAYHAGSSVIPEEVKDFIDKCYPQYIKYKDVMGLFPVINYYLLAKSVYVFDVRCLLFFILLECLSSHAKEYFESKGDSVDKTFVIQSEGKLKKFFEERKISISIEELKKLALSISYPEPSLPEVIRKIAVEFDFKYKEGFEKSEMWTWRKDFVHRGLFRDDDKIDRVLKYLTLEHFIDRLILTILGYKEKEFWNVLTRKYEKLP